MRLSARTLFGFLIGAAIVFGAFGLYVSGVRPVAAAGAVRPPGGGPVDISPDPAPAKPKPGGNIVYRLRPPHCCPGEVYHLPVADDAADWGHAKLDIPAAWKTSTGKGVKVAILDTGADHDHRDLKGRIVKSKDFTDSRSGPSDVQGHGTHCAGIVAAAKNGTGMVGVAPDAELLVGKVLNDSGWGFDTWIAAGVDWAVDEGADVISMSLGGPEPDDVTHTAIKRAVSRGVIVVVAAGNEGPREDTDGYPGRYPEVVSVAAINAQGLVADFSSRGKNVYVAAPGVNVRSCYPGDRFATMSGTSMATPYVAGCAALYVGWANDKSLKPNAEDFKARLGKTSADLPPTGRDTASGFGIVAPAKLFGPDDPQPPAPGDRIEWNNPGITFNGRKVKRIVIELEPAPEFAPGPIIPGLPPPVRVPPTDFDLFRFFRGK